MLYGLGDSGVRTPDGTKLSASHAGFLRSPDILAGVRATRRLITRTVRTAKFVARDPRIPKPLRWAAGLGLLPIPGPFDEAVLLLVAPILLIFYPGPMREAWKRANRQGV
jgi:hypothetical protein